MRASASTMLPGAENSSCCAEITVTGIFRYTDTWPLAIHLVASGQVQLARRRVACRSERAG